MTPEKECDNWNVKYPIGTSVMYKSGIEGLEMIHTLTKSSAQLLSGHSAVIWIEGKSGCVSLHFVTPIIEKGEGWDG